MSLHASRWPLVVMFTAGCYVGVENRDGGATGTSIGLSATIGSDTLDPTTDDEDDDGHDTTSSPATSIDPSESDEDADADSGTTGSNDSADESETDGSTGADEGPDVDVSDPQLYSFAFHADEADPEATLALGMQLAYLDTRVPPLGILAVYLHGSGEEPETCGGGPMGEVIASFGFHVIMPCYLADYGVENCGDDVKGCRLEAFEGVDHHPFLDVTPPDAIERRVVKGLQFVQGMHPGGDWQWFVEDDLPRWDAALISGISHGASSSGVIGQVRPVTRVVMLSGPYDMGQAWLLEDGITPADRYFGFTHTADEQHEAHLLAFEQLGLPGAPIVIGTEAVPWGGTHRLVTSAPTENGHGATQAGDFSPQIDGHWVFMPVWETMYVGD